MRRNIEQILWRPYWNKERIAVRFSCRSAWKFKISTCTTKEKQKQTRKRRVVYRKRKKQAGGFLNHYDFAYTGRDTVNQAAKIVPGVIKNASNEINNIAKQRSDQIISQGLKEIERVLPKVLRGAIEDVYQTPFRLLGNFEKQQLNKLKRKILS